MIRDTWLTFRRGGGFIFTMLFFLFLLMLIAGALYLGGDFYVNGRAVALDERARAGFAAAATMRSANLFAMLLILFHGGGLVLRGVERGSAAFDLTAPLSRERYLLGRLLGLLTILAAIQGVAVLLVEAVWAAKLGEARPALFAGLFPLLLAQALFAVMVILFRLAAAGGWAGMAALLVYAAGWFFSLDILETYLWDTGEPGAGGGWLIGALGPYLVGEPAGFRAALARAVVRFFPPAANAASVGIDAALGRPVYPRGDWWSLPITAAWTGIIGYAALRVFRRKDL